MQRIPVFLLLSTLLCFGCSSSSSTSDPVQQQLCTLTPNTEEKIQFNFNTIGHPNAIFGEKTFSVDFDSSFGPVAKPFSMSSRLMPDGSAEVTLFSSPTGLYFGDSIILQARLVIHIQKPISGEYDWTSSSGTSGPYGVELILAEIPGDYGDYKPISGHTLISFSDSKHSQISDSVFGSFCGTIQNKHGEQISVTDGKFFGTLPW